jgi:hypothetical protein
VSGDPGLCESTAFRDACGSAEYVLGLTVDTVILNERVSQMGCLCFSRDSLDFQILDSTFKRVLNGFQNRQSVFVSFAVEGTIQLNRLPTNANRRNVEMKGKFEPIAFHKPVTCTRDPVLFLSAFFGTENKSPRLPNFQSTQVSVHVTNQ